MHFVLFLAVPLVIVLKVFFPLTTVSLLKNLLYRLWGGHDDITLRYSKESTFCKSVIQKCPILKEKYHPPLWGYIGHMQTIWFAIRDVIISQPVVKSTRHYIHVEDGSTVTYDIFNPPVRTREEIMVVVPGISNTSQTDFIQILCQEGIDRGYCVAVLNHTGALKDQPITGNRIFTYAGTGDLTIMFDDLVTKFEPGTRFSCVGVSMGALILVRFLGERPKHRERIVCAMSVCQGYSSSEANKLGLSQWEEIRFFYYSTMVKRLLKVLKRHKTQLLTNHPVFGLRSSSNSTGSNGAASHKSTNNVSNGNSTASTLVPVPRIAKDRDCNGFAVDTSRICAPDEKMWEASQWKKVDEYYTRRVMGFGSYEEFRDWVSCIEEMHRIPDLPMLFVNAYDDPLIPRQLLNIPIKYTESNHRAMFVGTKCGGHCAFFEGGWFLPKETSWIDRLIFQYFEACSSTNQ